MALLESVRSASHALILILCLACLGLIVLRRSEQMSLVIQQPPSILTLDEATYFISSPSKVQNPSHLPHKGIPNNSFFGLSKVEYRFSKRASVSGPCTVIRVPNVQITPDDLIEIRRMLSQDDVWSNGFLQYLIFLPQTAHQTVQINTAAQQKLDTWGSQVLSAGNLGTLDLQQPGPYFCNAGQLHKVYRLYPDTAGAFMSATIQSPNDPYL